MSVPTQGQLHAHSTPLTITVLGHLCPHGRHEGIALSVEEGARTERKRYESVSGYYSARRKFPTCLPSNQVHSDRID